MEIKQKLDATAAEIMAFKVALKAKVVENEKD